MDIGESGNCFHKLSCLLKVVATNLSRTLKTFFQWIYVKWLEDSDEPPAGWYQARVLEYFQDGLLYNIMNPQ